MPRRLLVIGGGIIGLEMATVYHELGAKVTIVELLDQLIPGHRQGPDRPAGQAGHPAVRERLRQDESGVQPRPDGLMVSFEGEKAPAEPTPSTGSWSRSGAAPTARSSMPSPLNFKHTYHTID